jgi:hypothetical protein
MARELGVWLEKGRREESQDGGEHWFSGLYVLLAEEYLLTWEGWLI